MNNFILLNYFKMCFIYEFSNLINGRLDKLNLLCDPITIAIERVHSSSIGSNS